MKKIAIILPALLLFLAKPTAYSQGQPIKPRIINIVNFIRLLELRDPAITEDANILRGKATKSADEFLFKIFPKKNNLRLQMDIHSASN